MNNKLLDLLLIQSFDLEGLIEEYRLFFLGLLPFMFVLACLVEYFDRLNVYDLVKRALISVLILTSVTTLYKESIFASIEAANIKLEEQRQSNILLMDIFEGGVYLENLPETQKTTFYKDGGYIAGTLKFLKYHMFDVFVNDSFTVGVYFISQLCFLILKIVYSLVYYLGIGLIGIPCLIYIFPTMGNVLRGAILSFIWCLVVPHILVFILTMIGTEISKGYLNGQIIGGSVTGTALLFIMTLFVAFTPLIAVMLVNGSGMAQAGGIIASIGANYVMNLPRHSLNTGAVLATGGSIGPKAKLLAAPARLFQKPEFKLNHKRPGAASKAGPSLNFAKTKEGIKSIATQTNGALSKRFSSFADNGKAMNKQPQSHSQNQVKKQSSQNNLSKPLNHTSSLSGRGAKANRENLKNTKIDQNINDSNKKGQGASNRRNFNVRKKKIESNGNGHRIKTKK